MHVHIYIQHTHIMHCKYACIYCMYYIILLYLSHANAHVYTYVWTYVRKYRTYICMHCMCVHVQVYECTLHAWSDVIVGVTHMFVQRHLHVINIINNINNTNITDIHIKYVLHVQHIRTYVQHTHTYIRTYVHTLMLRYTNSHHLHTAQN